MSRKPILRLPEVKVLTEANAFEPTPVPPQPVQAEAQHPVPAEAVPSAGRIPQKKVKKQPKLHVPEGIKCTKAELVEWVKKYSAAHPTKGTWGDLLDRFTALQIEEAIGNAVTPWGGIMNCQAKLRLMTSTSTTSSSTSQAAEKVA